MTAAGTLSGGLAGGEQVGQPPLGRWGHAWRIAVAAVLGLAFLASTVDATPRPRPEWIRPLALIDIFVLGPIALVLLGYHRRRPMPVAVVVTLLTAVSSVASVAGLICLVSVAARRRPVEIAAIGTLGIASGVVYERIYPTSAPISVWFQLMFVALVITAAIAIGLFIGARRELVWSLRLRAEAAEREQELRVSRAQAEERARIAREMHDVLAHRISLLSMHAGALAFRTDLPPEELRAEARLIQSTAQEALTELRSVLGVLRDRDGGVERPQPTLTDLDDLVEQARAAGPVVVRRELDGASPPAWIGRQAYRIVQESLTNARKHAPGAPVQVRLSGRAGERLVVDVVNEPLTSVAGQGDRHVGSVSGNGSVPGAGLGLIGLAERATAAGGSFEHGRRPDGSYAVRATLPWPVDSITTALDQRGTHDG